MFHTISQGVKLVLVFCIVVTVVGCTSATVPQPSPTQKPTGQIAPTVPQPPPTQKPAGQIANPASENCMKQGGTLTMQKRGDGGEYGICMFEDNRQCEEWALLHGECPVGGRKITGYVTLAAQYCAITGGTYQVTGNSNTDQEQGSCTFKNGQTCDVWDYFAGKCNPNAEAEQSSYTDPWAYCAAVGTIDTPDGRYTGAKLPDSIIQGMVQQGIVAADAPKEFQQNAVWRCMDNSVWVCHFGANLPCQEKADTAQVPTAGMEDHCKTNPTADSIPAAVTGRATVYEWGCKDGKPQVIKQVFKSDSQGYLADFWYKLSLTPAATPTQNATEGWPTYTNDQAGFSLQYPPGWSQAGLPAQNNGALQGVALQGAEGVIELYWGVGFGGGCPEGYQTIKAAQGELPTCYTKNDNGTERWEQISKDLGKIGFSARAYTNNSTPASREAILQAISTLTFR